MSAGRGAGKYDELATYVRENARAKAVLVLVLEGDKGDGFSLQAIAALPPALIVAILRDIAREIELEGAR